MTRWLARATMVSPASSGWRSESSTPRREFRQLVEEEHAVMGERHFARPRPHAAADHRRHRGGMVRRAERPPVRQLSVGQLAGDRGDHRDFQELARRERRQDRGQPRSPASTCRRRAGRPSACCARRRRRSRARAGRSPGPSRPSCRECRRRRRGWRAAGATAPACRGNGSRARSGCRAPITGSSSPAQAASGPQAPGQISPRAERVRADRRRQHAGRPP